MSVEREQPEDAGDLRLRPFGTDTGRLAARIALIFLISNLLATFAKAILAPEFAGPVPVAIDFHVYWEAARQAVQGMPLDAFAPVAVPGSEATGPGGAPSYLFWVYPPIFLLLLTPLGALPFVPAWALFDAMSLAAVALALRPFTRTEPAAWRFMIAAPALLPALWVGQNSLLFLAGLVGALACIRDERMVTAGILIGLLTFKPQLGILIPVALLAAGLWRTILAACVSAVAVALLPTLVFGFGYWPALSDTLREFGSVLHAGAAQEPLICTTFGVLSQLGVNPDAAMAAQWGIVALAAWAVWRCWRSPTASFDLKAATLAAAIPAASPHLWHYDTAFLAATGLFLLRAGVLEFRPAGLTVFGLCWLGAGPALLVVNLLGGVELPVGFILAPLVLAALGLCIAAVPRRDAAAREA
ncbi:glycosyltransferase family 87 protein [Tropicimonas aquimaris]|uniref:Glycosyltransferase family 87 protein n=1 Tax=Tropicimonas aquimaris TaxID=914152 RepID=A0ABW3IMA6_9RHOB